MAPPVYSVAVCLFTDVTALDFQGPVDLFRWITPEVLKVNSLPEEPAFAVEVTYFAVTMDPIRPSAGAHLVPDRTYESLKPGEQFDILLVPGGALLCLLSDSNFMISYS